MNDTYLLFGILAGFAVLAYPVLVLVHELGHAVPALLLTRAPVTVYLGSYGDRRHTWRVQLGALELCVKRNLFWTKGLCVHASQNLSRISHILITLGGVVASTLVAVLAFYGALVFDLHGAVKLLLFILVVLAIISLIANLVPSEHSGFANDGRMLKVLLTNKQEAPVVKFSPELQALIMQSRTVAIDLGYDHISTLHLFLADCAMPYPYSLAELCFPSQAAYAIFYERCRLGPAGVGVGFLPLTAEYEQALKRAPLAQQEGFRSELHPCHLFLASAGVADAAWLEALAPKADLSVQLLAHYRSFAELVMD